MRRLLETTHTMDRTVAVMKKGIISLSMSSSSGERVEVWSGEEGVTADLLTLSALLLVSVVALLRVVVVTVVGVDIVVVVVELVVEVVVVVDDLAVVVEAVVDMVTVLGVVTSWSTVWLMARTAPALRLAYTARFITDTTSPSTATILVPVFREK